MNRTILGFGVAAVTAAALGLPVDQLAGGLGFAVGLVMIGGHLLGLEDTTRRLGPLLLLCFATTIVWGGLASFVRTVLVGLLSAPAFWAVAVVLGTVAVAAPLLLAVAHVVPEPEAPGHERPRIRERARVVEPDHGAAPVRPRASAPTARPDDTDEFGFFEDRS